MNRPGELQTFSFDSAADLHWKLYWEVARMNAAPQDIIDLKCFAFNAAVTAWQLTDWTFDDMSAKQKKDRGCRRVSRLSKPSTVNVPTFALMR
jgi:hypothetical protein